MRSSSGFHFKWRCVSFFKTRYTEQVQKKSPDLSEVKHKPVTTRESNIPEPIVEQLQTLINQEALELPQLACKKCNNTVDLQATWGKFGYYVKCPKCDTNTAMKQSCPSCNSKETKINKKKAHYYLTCQGCNAQNEIFVQL